MSATDRLSELIRMPTVSAYDSSDENNEIFALFPDRLAALYPSAHKAMERKLPGDRAILFKWNGSDSSLDPVLGMAHYDVVPPGDVKNWDYPPFSGIVENGRIYGRGSLDDKGMLASWMEGVESLVSSGYQPRRTLYLAFGGDEETTGIRGAGRISEFFTEQQIRFAFILDEGGAVAVDQLSAFTDRPVALVGIAEKGYLTLRITAKGMSGHASSPPKHTAIGRLGQAVAALESSPFPPRLTEAPAGMLRALGHAVKGPKSILLKNPGIFGSILSRALSSNLATAPLVRTTLAPTVLRGGEQDNVLPDKVEAWVNLRLLPGDSVSSAVKRVEAIIDRAVDSGVSVHIVEGSAFEPVSCTGGSGRWWDLIGSMIDIHHPNSVAVPYLMIGTTDSRSYRDLSENIYRFNPIKINSQEMNCVHSSNESISEAHWLESVAFIEGLLKNALKQ